MHSIAAQPHDADMLLGEEAELEFVMAFRELLRLKNILVSFSDFSFDDTGITEQTFDDFKSKYLDIYDKVRQAREKDKVSILEDVDFELELVRRDEVNVDYILKLVARLVGATDEQRNEITKTIFTTISGDATLRSKRELIEKFINSTIPQIHDSDEVEDRFTEFWNDEKQAELERIASEEGIVAEKLEKLIDRYVFTNRKPKQTDFADTLATKPGILQRNTILKRISARFGKFVETFVDGV